MPPHDPPPETTDGRLDPAGLPPTPPAAGSLAHRLDEIVLAEVVAEMGIAPGLEPASAIAAFLRHFRHGVIFIDANASIALANPALCEMLRMGAADLLETPLLGLLDARSREVALEHLSRCRHGSGEPYELVFDREQGTPVRALITPHPCFSGEVHLGCLALVTKLSEPGGQPPGGETETTRLLGTMLTRLRPEGSGAEHPYGPSLLRLAELAVRAGNAALTQRLSKREVEVLALLLDGFRPADVAQHLFISPHTVRNHLKRIFSKLEVHSQRELRALFVPVTSD